jgi:hypothetical protein
VYVYPAMIHPTPVEMPEKEYIDGGFKPSADGLTISERDAKILGNYLTALKEWGSAGWLWVTDYYIVELKKYEEKLPNAPMD